MKDSRNADALKKRCIMIFPHFNNVHVINDIRKKYDPLAAHVRPHITLIFPFESDIDTDNLKEHIEKVISDIKPFHITLSGITPENNFGKYLFLNIIEGKESVIELHNRLYTRILEVFYPQWLKYKGFIPHMTLGYIDDEGTYKKAVEETMHIKDEFETMVDTVSVEIIDANEDSIIELEIPLGLC